MSIKVGEEYIKRDGKSYAEVVKIKDNHFDITILYKKYRMSTDELLGDDCGLSIKHFKGTYSTPKNAYSNHKLELDV